MQTITLFLLTFCGMMVADALQFRVFWPKGTLQIVAKIAIEELYNVNNPIDHCVFQDAMP